MKLTSENVREVFLDSLYKESETDRSGAVMVAGIIKSVGFHPERLNANKEKIIDFLNQLDDNFKESCGGGYTFLSVPFDKNNVQWGEHINAEELCLLGMGIKKMGFLFPRELWTALPGGVPYLVIYDKEKE